MSTINHEAARERAEGYYVNRSKKNVILNKFDLNLSRAYLDLAAQLEAAHAKIEKYQRRLEITHCYDGHTGERKEIQPEKRDTYPDGIECRDSTIYILKTELAVERDRVKELESALGEAMRTMRDDADVFNRLTAIKEGRHE